MTSRHNHRISQLIAGLCVATLTLSACGGTGAPGSGGDAGTGRFTYLGQTQNSTIVGTLKSLAEGACSAENQKAPLSPDAVDGTTWDQQLQVLAGQDALSNVSMASGAPALMKEFIDAGKVQNISSELKRLGVKEDKILPAAASTIRALYGKDDLYALPTEFNVEGFWYNKKILSDHGIAEPTTWAELSTAAAKLKAAGIQPFVAAGSDGWPVTRLVGNYLFRSLGPDALERVAQGQARLTDSDYVKAADAVAEWGKAGFFGAAPGSIDYNTAMNQFLTGGGAFFYMGSWALGNFNDASQNQIGVDNIGFLPFPAVEGGKGSRDQIPANVGIPVMFTTAKYTEETAAWLKCVTENYGDAAMKGFGQVTGFVTTASPAEPSQLTTQVQQIVATAPSSVLWFEAHFTPEGTTVSQTNGGALASGSLTGAQFMELVQAANKN